MSVAAPARTVEEPSRRTASLLRLTWSTGAWLENNLWPAADLLIRGWFAWRLLEASDSLGPIAWIIATLLAIGLFTPPVALITIIVCVLAQIGFVGHAAEVGLLVWLAVTGASVISLDQAFRIGARSFAVPGASQVHRLFARLGDLGVDPMLFVLRLLAAAMLIAAALVENTSGFLLSGWQPGDIGGPAQVLLVLAGIALALGFAVQVTGLLTFLALVLFAGDMAVGPAFLMLPLGLRGGGVWSLDRLIRARLDTRWPFLLNSPRWDDRSLPRVVIVGAGFGGVQAARDLCRAPCRVTLVDRRNYHLFQPLLYQVATAGLSPADIATPIREIFSGQENIQVQLGRVSAVDLEEREVVFEDNRVGYDYLVLATGARHAYFGHEEWEPLAPGLKKIDDATIIRRRILMAFEEAERAEDEESRKAFLTFIVTGGGPTGVEIAGTLIELAHNAMVGDFRRIDPKDSRVILVEGGPKLLAPFPDALSAYTKEALEELGVEIMLERRVEHIDETGVVAGGEFIAARTVIWGAGVMASPAGKWVGAEVDRTGRALVDEHLNAAEHPDIFVIGDTALSKGWDGKPVPGLAPAAKQQGAYVARRIHDLIVGRSTDGPFRYVHQGSLATIGRQAAVADLGRVWLKGAVAWWFWGLVHVLFLVDNRNKVAVMLEWFWAYLTFRRSTRLITGSDT